jgi:thiol-disulfide isomerase/thioredoxin
MARVAPRRWWMAAAGGLGAAAAMAAAALLLAGGGGAPLPSGDSVSPGEWVLPRLGAPGSLSLASLRGRPAVVALFTSGCAACDANLGLLAGADQELRGQITFVGVDCADGGRGLTDARAAGAGSWLLARDVGGRGGTGLLDALQPSGALPVTAFYSREGTLLSVQTGELSAAGLGTILYQLYGARLRL